MPARGCRARYRLLRRLRHELLIFAADVLSAVRRVLPVDAVSAFRAQRSATREMRHARDRLRHVAARDSRCLGEETLQLKISHGASLLLRRSALLELPLEPNVSPGPGRTSPPGPGR